MKLKCIRYSVDPNLLNAGIPIEQLEKKNIQEIPFQETMQHFNRYSQSTAALHKEKASEYHPQPPEYLEIELSSSDYNKVMAGKLIKISTDIAPHNGKRFRITNKTTGSYIKRTLVVLGNKGYWR
jgi:hypothetical protein